MIHLSVTVKSRWCPGERPKLWNSVCLRPLITNHLSFRCVWTRMTHGLRNTVGSTMCKCAKSMVCEVWDQKGRWEEGTRQCVYTCVSFCACVCFRWEYMCRGGIRWFPSPPSNWRDLQYNKTIELTLYSLIASILSSHFTTLISHEHNGWWGISFHRWGLGGLCVMAASGTVTQHQFTHRVGLHLCAQGCKHVAWRERERVI